MSRRLLAAAVNLPSGFQPPAKRPGLLCLIVLMWRLKLARLLLWQLMLHQGFCVARGRR